MRRIPLFFLVSIAPAAARACSVCFTGADPKMARGLYWGVVMLLLLPPVLIAGLAGLVVFHTRRNRLSVAPSLEKP